MRLIRTKGLVIKETAVGESDKIITLLTEDAGRISVSARGARKNGRSSYGTQILTYGQYILFKGRNGYTMNGCDILATFYDLARDLERFTYAAHMIEMASDASSDEQTTGRVLNLLLHGLHAIMKGRQPLLVSSAFTMKLMQICGYPPHVTSCVSCGEKELDEIYFSSGRCGFVCKNCARTCKDAVPVSTGTAKAILHVLCSENPGVFNFALSKENLESFSNIASRYITDRFDKRYGKLDFLKEIDKITHGLGGARSMKKHLFTSGEKMYGKNRKQLKEGLFVAEYIEYGEFSPETEYICVGKLNGRNAAVRFSLADDQLELIGMKHAYNILMQSDILGAKWKSYSITYV